MVALISFFFLLFFSTLFAILFSYFILEDESDNLNVVLISILGSSISFILSKDAAASSSSLTYGLGLLIVIYLSMKILKSTSQTYMILSVFPGIIGMLVGFGFVFEVIVLMVFLYIVRSSFGYIDNSNSISDVDGDIVENSDN